MGTCLLAVLCCMTACAASALLFGATVDVLRRRRAGVSGQPSGQLGAYARVLRAGVGWMRPFARAAFQVGAVRSWANEAALSLGQRGIPASAENACSLAVVAVVAVLCAGWAVSGDFAAGCAVAACVVLALRGVVKRGSDERLEALRDAVPEALRSLGVCFQAGFSLLQTFRQTASELQGPLRESFEQAVHVLETGGTVSEALECLRKSSSSELAFVAVALDVQHTAGGSMRQVLDAAGDSIAAEAELRRSMRVQTAQAKLSARVVSVMPFVLIAVFTLTTEDFLAPFFQSFAGFALLFLAVAMQASGILLVRRMLTVEEF